MMAAIWKIPLGREAGVVVEGAAEVVAVGKISSCKGRKTPAESTR